MPTDEPNHEDRTDPDEMDPADYRAGWERATRQRRLGFGEAFDHLVDAGCDGADLTRLMTRLEAAPLPTRSSRSDLVQASEVLVDAKDKLRWLQFSDVAERVFDEPTVATRLIEEIRGVVSRVEAQVPEADRRVRRLHNERVAALVRYVRERTGDYHDAHVSVLVEAAVEPEDAYTADAHRQWRFRHRDLLG